MAGHIAYVANKIKEQEESVTTLERQSSTLTTYA
jgi:hypothetical protein